METVSKQDMRIIAGEYRGRIIRMPKDANVRPTQDRVREAVFNVIRERIPRSSVLDLYAGSGAFGIEALSRGAERILFVDNNINCAKIIKENIAIFKDTAERTQVLKLDAIRAISRLEKEGKFDIIFLDPPYYKEIAKNALIKIGACAILSERGFIAAEHAAKDILPDETGCIRLVKRKIYGDTAVSYYKA